jgi:hypothetical protein
LLARKGFAAPVGAPLDAAATLAPAPETESLPEIAAPAPSGTAPPASLLPLDFLTGAPGLGGLAPPAPERPGVATAAAAKPEPDAVVAPAVSAKPEAKPAAGGDPGPEISAGPDMPRPDPGLRIAAGATPGAGAETRRFPALAAGLALALVFGAAGYGYKTGGFDSKPPERVQTPAAAARIQAEPIPAEPTPAERSQAETPAAAPSLPDSDPGADQAAGAGQPSVDIVRIEPDGAAVIAGRAAPGTELILLDNGAPIGTVAADIYGEWVFIPVSPLPSGAHDFGLVIKEVRGGASLPAPGQAPRGQDAEPESAAPGVSGINEPGTVAGAAAAVPIPPRKPNAGARQAAGTPSPAFVVQLASVKTRAGARREWLALRKRFPELLSPLSLDLDEAKLAGGDTVVRLRIGAFSKQTEAAALCARLASKHQDCLVVRTAAER